MTLVNLTEPKGGDYAFGGTMPEARPIDRHMNMIERVSRAICLSDGLNPMDRIEAGGETFFRWEINQPRAFTVMAEIRLPTIAMLTAGLLQYCVDPDTPDEEIERIWGAMTDAAGTNSTIGRDYLDRTRRALRSDKPHKDA